MNAPLEMSTKAAKAEIRSQHERLRNLMQHIGMLARAATLGAVVPELRKRITLLLDAVNDHNRREASLMQPILSEFGAWGNDMIKEMISHHTNEHDMLQGAIESACREGMVERDRAHTILAALDQLERHMAREEAAIFKHTETPT
jgi:hypothetical protein